MRREGREFSLLTSDDEPSKEKVLNTAEVVDSVFMSTSTTQNVRSLASTLRLAHA